MILSLHVFHLVKCKYQFLQFSYVQQCFTKTTIDQTLELVLDQRFHVSILADSLARQQFLSMQAVAASL